MNLKYRVEFSKEAKKYLKRLDKTTTEKILNAIETIRESPKFHLNITKMEGYEGEVYRLRVGNIRILYEIIDDILLITVFRIGPRGDVYK